MKKSNPIRQSQPEKPSEKELRYRKLLAETELAEKKAMDLEASVASVESIATLWDETVQDFHRRIEKLPKVLSDKVAALTEAIDCQAAVDPAVHEALTDLANYKPSRKLIRGLKGTQEVRTKA